MTANAHPFRGTPEAMVGGAFHAMPSPAMIVDWAGDIVLANRLAKTSFGLEETFGGARPNLSAYFELEAASLMDLLKDGVTTSHVELTSIPRGKERAKTVKFRSTLIQGSESGESCILLAKDFLSETIGMIARVNDHRRSVAEKLERAKAGNEELTTSLHAMEVFTNAASHDLRNPISVVRGLIDHLERDHTDTLTPAVREILGVMSNAADQMNNLTTKLLDHARSATGPLQKAPVRLRRHLEMVCRDLAPLLQDAGGTIDIDCKDVEILADGGLFEVLCSNLIGNAIKYRDVARPLRIRVSHRADRLYVADNGVGFSNDQAKRMFEAFQQLNADNARGGTGLGLATCFEICRRHGWDISADGIRGEGATFCVVFEQ